MEIALPCYSLPTNVLCRKPCWTGVSEELWKSQLAQAGATPSGAGRIGGGSGAGAGAGSGTVNGTTTAVSRR
jgi:hypothetical protein